MKKKRILVIDDLPEQRQHALNVLQPAYEVVVAPGYNEGKKAIEEDGPWDIVLTDLSMPPDPHWKKFVGQGIPSGYPLAMLALRAGVKKIAIVSTGQAEDNHHAHPIYAASDDIYGEIIADRFWAFTGVYGCPRMNENTLPGVEHPYYIKDWFSVVKKMEGEKVEFSNHDDEIKPVKSSEELEELVKNCRQAGSSSSNTLLISWAKLGQNVPTWFGGLSDTKGIPGYDDNPDLKKKKEKLIMWFYIIREEDEGLGANFMEDNKAEIMLLLRKEVPSYLKEKFPEVFVEGYFAGTWEEVLKKIIEISNAVIEKENEVLEVPTLPQ